MSERSLNRHQRRKIRTRKQLEQATKELLIEKGYDAITIQEIVDRADLGRGTFYLHFQDKEEAVWSMIERGLREEDMFARQLAESQPDGFSLLDSFITIFRQAEINRDLFTVMLGLKGSGALTSRLQDWLAEDLQHQLDAMLPNNVPPDFAAQLITGGLTRLLAWWLTAPNQHTPEEMAQRFYAALSNGIITTA
jgi:AcrR family transcriptional regulator